MLRAKATQWAKGNKDAADPEAARTQVTAAIQLGTAGLRLLGNEAYGALQGHAASANEAAVHAVSANEAAVGTQVPAGGCGAADGSSLGLVL